MAEFVFSTRRHCVHFGMVAFAVTSCLLSSVVHASPVTFRFDAEVNEIIADENDIFGATNPGDEIHGIFTYDDFDAPVGVHPGALRIDLGTLVLSSNQYNWFWSDDGSGLIGSEGTGDSVSLYCPGGQSSSTCELAPIQNTFLGWDGSLSFGSRDQIFEIPPTSEIPAPAAALRLAETWNKFENRQLLLAVKHISGFGSSAVLRASIGEVTLVPEPSSIVIFGISIAFTVYFVGCRPLKLTRLEREAR